MGHPPYLPPPALVMRPKKLKYKPGEEGKATRRNPLQRGHLLSEHRHARVTHLLRYFSSFLLRSRQIDIWSRVRLALFRKSGAFNDINDKNKVELFELAPLIETTRQSCEPVIIVCFPLRREGKRLASLARFTTIWWPPKGDDIEISPLSKALGFHTAS